MNNYLYILAQWTWGLPQTLIGAAVCFVCRKDGRFGYNGAIVTAWDRSSGISLGRFIFVPRIRSERKERDSYLDEVTGIRVDNYLLGHEYGHTVQSLILGPAYLLIIGIPSLLWSILPYFDRKRKETGKSYYSAIFEKNASNLGASALKKRKGN